MSWPNPNTPIIDPQTSGLKDAVVFLRNLTPDRARPWDHPPVRIRIEDQQLRVCQGEEKSRVGFVQVGDAVEMVSADPLTHSLHASGAAFFTLTLPDPGQPRMRRLVDAGILELSSATGCFWMRGYLFVDHHPYYTRTDASGRFLLTDVPPGEYEVVCWHPNWSVERQERDPETSLLKRVLFRPAREQVRRISVGPQQSCSVHMTFADLP
jgi:hypothetical protein